MCRGKKKSFFPCDDGGRGFLGHDSGSIHGDKQEESRILDRVVEGELLDSVRIAQGVVVSCLAY